MKEIFFGLGLDENKGGMFQERDDDADTAAFVHFVRSGNKKAVDGSLPVLFSFFCWGFYFVGNKSEFGNSEGF